MNLREAYSTLIYDILINKELGFDKEIDSELANKITKSLLNNYQFLIEIEEFLTEIVGCEVDTVAGYFGLYE